jgi:membrane protein involved in colicin uptake
MVRDPAREKRMSEKQNQTTTTTPTTAEVPKPAPPVEPARDTTDWKAEARKWEARAKENAKAAERLAELEEASKTDAEKQAEALAEAQAKIAEYEAREQIAAWKREVAEETGVPAEALAGTSLEEIKAHAEVLKPLIQAQGGPQLGTIVPYVPSEGTSTGAPALNGDELAEALKAKLGIC